MVLNSGKHKKGSDDDDGDIMNTYDNVIYIIKTILGP